MVGSAAPQPLPFGFRVPQMEPTHIHLYTTAAASLRLSHRLSLSLKHVLKQKFCHVHILKKLFGRAFMVKEVNALQLSGTFASSCSSFLYFFDGGQNRKHPGDESMPKSGTSTNSLFNKRKWTNVLLAVNIFIYVAQVATQGKLLLWGAKVNSLIDRGQIWRLVTSSFLHANIVHLMVNCYSLNSVGPTMENICGPRRFLAVYMTSAIASSMTSYWLSKPPSVGASGAIFGLVGSLAVFIVRHRSLVKSSGEDLQHIARVILLNMVIGLSTKGIDNWGHVGGLLGGAAASWLIGPAWKYESRSQDGRTIYVDKAPIFYLTKGRNRMRR